MAIVKKSNRKSLCTFFFAIIMAFQVCNNCTVVALSSSSSNNNNNNNHYLDSLKPTSSASIHNTRGQDYHENEKNQFQDNSMEEDAMMTMIAKNTPDDHYAKHHPGAGWAGYKHPMYGGYLDHLQSSSLSASSSSSSSLNNDEETTTPPTTAAPTAEGPVQNTSSTNDVPSSTTYPSLDPPQAPRFHPPFQANDKAVDKSRTAVTRNLSYLETLQRENT
mmetsp:Transcript_41749/g.100523  ORF Transcript_41749/g.100523 Transcript_41749/m.100523 type:complete len:219 (-) Transcript_41749:580-1236(-)|eukprot:CAMPEP_0113633170 /NCGR_PEP_ID=MMETSP0017_2-20120614/17256_1 /TAXON_ID=2856 /ORGANISM="Cylindrotheca closterium" /LENGTH=218 /DNA_ID=CAMNT_0000543785 /DNA_START=74 /DNA_END=730 /DNA_ORIENTATION=- /assembly_acc=CAM_ASM_000147